jgi:hypothetical protein
MRVIFLVISLSCSAAAVQSWTLQNNTNVRHGDIAALDFKLPAGTSEVEGVATCLLFCSNHTECYAFTYVRGNGGRCAIKGKTGWCVDTSPDNRCVSAVKPGTKADNCTAPGPTPPGPVPGPGEWRLPAINWTAGGTIGPTDQYSVRAFDVVFWEPEAKWYLYCDLVLFSNSKCPASFGSEIGCFSANSLDGEWQYHGIVVPKNTSAADAGGLATPTATVHDGKVKDTGTSTDTIAVPPFVLSSFRPFNLSSLQ